MVKFIVIKKNLILKWLFIILLIPASIFLIYIFKGNSIPSFISSTIHNETEKDFDGDGTIDELLIDKKNNHYVIKIKTSKNEYILKDNILGDSLIDLYDSVSIRVYSFDLSRDNIPELILCGYKDNKPVTYIFRWNDDMFVEAFSTNNNIFGILDSNNSRTPKMLSALSELGDESTECFIFNGLETKDLTFSSPQIPSLGVIQKFIDLIQLDYDLAETPGLFTSYINSDELSILWNLHKEKFRYAFQNGFFYDVNWDKSGLPASISWTLSFEKVNFLDSSKLKEEVIFLVKADINEFGEYKISSIKKYN